jgi:hypothetical protein
LGFVFASDEGSATIGVVVFVAIDLTQVKKIQQDVLQWKIFKDLCALDSSIRFYEEGGSAYPAQEHTLIAEHKIRMLRNNINIHNSSHQPPLLNQGLSTLPTKGLST